MERHPRATPTQLRGTRTLPSNAVVVRPCAPSSTPYCARVCGYASRSVYRIHISSRAHAGHTCTCAHPRAMRSGHRRMQPPQHSPAMHVLQSRRSGAFSVALTAVPLRVLIRAYISKPVVTAPPRRYLSHASGADFYRRGDSRGKFIKSSFSALPRAHHALSRGLGGRGYSPLFLLLFLYFLRLSVV